MRTHEKWLLLAIVLTVLRWVAMATLDGSAKTAIGITLGVLTLAAAGVALVTWRRLGRDQR